MSAAAAAAASSVERGDEETGAGADRCGRLYDNVTYWPLTSPGQLAVVACPPHFRGLPLTSGQSHGEMRRFGARVNVGSWQRRLEYQPEVIPRRARPVLRWVTVFARVYHLGM